jgi:hypothetical protein
MRSGSRKSGWGQSTSSSPRRLNSLSSLRDNVFTL